MFRFALVGCGRMARLHAAAISPLGKLEAVYDPDTEKAERFVQEFGAKRLNSLESLLQNPEVDIVCICTPNGYHAEHCIRSLQAGKHVFCETPLCLTRAGAWQIIETEKYCRRKLCVFNLVSFHPFFSELRNSIRAHTNGHPYRFTLHCSVTGIQLRDDWRGTRFPGGGALYTVFSNYIDALVYLFGEIDSVDGQCRNLASRRDLEFEDMGEAELVMKTGIKGRLSWNLSDNANHPSFLEVSPLRQLVRVDDLDNLLTPSEADYLKMYQQFVLSLETETPSSASPFDSVRTVEAIENIYKAVSLNLLPNN